MLWGEEWQLNKAGAWLHVIHGQYSSSNYSCALRTLQCLWTDVSAVEELRMWNKSTQTSQTSWPPLNWCAWFVGKHERGRDSKPKSYKLASLFNETSLSPPLKFPRLGEANDSTSPSSSSKPPEPADSFNRGNSGGSSSHDFISTQRRQKWGQFERKKETHEREKLEKTPFIREDWKTKYKHKDRSKKKQ